MKKVLSVLLCATIIFCLVPGGTVFSVDGMEKGLVLYAPTGVTVNLYSGMPSGTSSPNTANKVTETRKETKDGVDYHYFINLAASDGGYHFQSKGTGYYTLLKVLNFSAEKAETLTYVDANPQKKSGNGYEATTVNANADELVNNVLTADEGWKTKYPEVYTVPTLKEGNTKAAHEFTSQEDMESYISALDGAEDNLYRYSLGKSPVNSFEIPLIIFTKTDISSCTEYKQAAEVIKDNGKPTIMYQAQIHGNEPAGGDGALSVIAALDGEYGENVLDSINIVIIPRANPDGSKAYTRNNVYDNFDMNRDHIKVQSTEVTLVHEVYNTFLPQAFIDGHEYAGAVTTKSGEFRDVLLAVGGGYNTTSKLTEVGVDAVNGVVSGLNDAGLRATYYPSVSGVGAVENKLMVNTANFSSGRGYYSLKGCVTLLVETRGIYLGKQAYERRVVGQYVAVTSLIDYICNNMQKFCDAVEYERNWIIEQGKTFDENNLFGLYSSSTLTDKEITWSPKYNYLTGVLTSSATYSQYNYYYDKAERVRPRATAYVLPKNAENADEVIEIIRKHAIDYYEVPANTTIRLRKYGGNAVSSGDYFVVDNATLTPDKDFTFENGAYIFTTNQVSGTLLMYLFEPDVTDTQLYGSSFCQSGTLKTTDIYRYEHDLETDGKVYSAIYNDAPEGITAVQPASNDALGKITGLDSTKVYKLRNLETGNTVTVSRKSELDGLAAGEYGIKFDGENNKEFYFSIIDYSEFDSKIYVNSKSGDDKNNGLSKTEAVKTLTKAYELLNAGLLNNGETYGRIVFCADYTITDTEFAVGSNSTVGLPASSYTVELCGLNSSVKLSSIYTLAINSDTVFKNITVYNSSTSSSQVYRYICGNGYKLTIDKNVTNSAYNPVSIFSVIGGKYSGTTAKVDLTVKSGIWRNIYFANYSSGNVAGKVNVEISGGEVTTTFTTSYSAVTSADINVKVTGNAKISGKTYLGNSKKENYSGNIVLYIGNGADMADVYCGSRDAGNVTGSAAVILNGGKVTTLHGNAANNTGTVNRSTFCFIAGNYTDALDFTEQKTVISGDVNCDGIVNVSDCVCICLYLDGKKTFDIYNIAAADINGDGTVVRDESTALAKKIAGTKEKINIYPTAQIDDSEPNFGDDDFF